MLPSTQNAGFSLAGPVAPLVTVSTQMSRPSWLLPIASIVDEGRMLARERVQELGELGVAVEAIEGDVRHCVRARRGEVCRPRTNVASPLQRVPSYVIARGRTVAVCTQRRPRAGQKAPTTVYLCGMASPDLLPAYAELHCLSNFTFLRGASHPEELVERAQEPGLRGARDHRRMLARRRRARALAAKDASAAARSSAASSRSPTA